MSDHCTLSLYVPHRFYLPLLDVLVKELGFRSRSLCLTQLFERLFFSRGLIDKHGQPTAKALAASPEIAALLRADKAHRRRLKRQHAQQGAVLESLVQTAHALPARPRRRRHRRH